jgi:hypothetical protein
MGVAFRVVVAFLTLSGLLVNAQEKSFGQIAAEEERRRQVITKPAKVYTTDDLPPAEVRLGGICTSETKYDPASGNTTRTEKCPDGITTEYGSNARTGSKWVNRYFPDGRSEGIDACGRSWTYDPKTTLYVSDAGEVRIGLGEFRRRLASPAACPNRHTGTVTSDTTIRPLCGPETAHTDTAGNRYTRQPCQDGTLTESGMNPKTGTSWQSTIWPDGSQKGNNSCGVSWSYDAASDRYTTSIGENGMGRNIFLANLERINRCEVYQLRSP